jgi:SHS2 domain-containing protein
MEARCVWAGRVRAEVRIELGSGTSVRELASDKPLAVADGSLELLGVMPPRSIQHVIATKDYRFALKFSGGL